MTITDTSTLTTRHITYGTHADNFGELRLPAGGGPHPTIIYVHGGGWRSEVTLAGAAGICSALQAQGVATWSVEYRRLGSGGGWPTTFSDVLAAAGHLHVLADEGALDLARVFVGGQSAGGQLALWLASRARHDPDAASSARLPAFRGVIALAPATDLRTSASRGPDSPVPLLLGGTPERVPERYADTSPIELAPIGVPQLVVHGTADRMVPYAMSQTYVRTAQERGDRVDLVTIDGADHLELWTPGSAAFEPVVEAVSRFIANV